MLQCFLNSFILRHFLLMIFSVETWESRSLPWSCSFSETTSLCGPLESLSNSGPGCEWLNDPFLIFLGPTGPLVCWLLHVLISCRPCHGFLIYSHCLCVWTDSTLKRHPQRQCRTSDPSWWPREFHCGCCAATSETLPSCHFCKRQMSKIDLELRWI